MPLNFDAMTAEVTRNESADESAALLLKKLFDEVEANKANPGALQALVDRVRASNDKLVTAISANTPAEEPAGGGTPEPGTPA